MQKELMDKDWLRKEMIMMQKCKICGASWDIERILDVCPFCGANLREKPKISSIEDAFKIILEKHGQSAFQSGILMGLLGDYAPMLIREKKLVKVAIEAGAYKALCEANVSERKEVINKYTSILSESFFIDEVWAKKVLLWCSDALSGSAESVTLHSDDQIIVKNGNEADKTELSGLSSVPVEDECNKQTEKDLNISDGVLIKYNGSQSTLVLPNTIHRIAQNAFYSNKSLNEVVIPSNVRVIEKSAFAYCSNLEIIDFSDGLEQIGESSFVYCKKLKNIRIPNSVAQVGKYAFQGCVGLTTVQMAENIMEIEEGTFLNCQSLTNIIFPARLSIIRKMAFAECFLIESIMLPELLEMIEPEAFLHCRHLKKINVTSNIEISSEVFSKFPQLSIPEINYMKKNSVVEKEKLISDELVISNMESVPKVRDRAIEWDNVTSLKIEEGIEEVSMEAFAGMRNLQHVELPQSLKKIGFGAFRDCTRLNNVVIPPSVTTISAHAFEKCNNLTNIIIPDSVKYIGDDAFRNSSVKINYIREDCVICKGNYQIRHQ